MSTVREVTDHTFQTDVLSSDRLAVVDFWAPWCMPCRMMGPILEQVARNNNGKVNFFKLDIDNNQSTAERYGIMSIPSLVFFKDSKEIKRIIGVRTLDFLESELHQALLKILYLRLYDKTNVCEEVFHNVAYDYRSPCRCSYWVSSI